MARLKDKITYFILFLAGLFFISLTHKWMTVRNSLWRNYPQCMQYDMQRQLGFFFGTAAAVMFIKKLIATYIKPIFESNLCKVRYPVNSASRYEKVEKLEEHLMKIVFHVIINSIHYWVIKDAKFLHWSFGGKYEDLQFFENYPCLDLPKY